jgi:hypoxia up-regulated 1
LGGNRINTCLRELTLEKFFSKYNLDHKEQTVRGKKLKSLYLTLQKTKHVLSVNKESRVYVEDFWNDKDLSLQVTVSEMEEKCADYFTELKQFLDEFKQEIVDRELSLDKVEKVELLGGGVRVPRVGAILEEAFKTKSTGLYNHLNGDEAMALGASFVAANYSSSFKPRPIFIEDGPGYDINVKIMFGDDEEREFKDGKIYETGKSRYGHKKTISLNDVKGDLTVELMAEDEDNYKLEYLVGGFTAALKSIENKNVTDVKTNLYFDLSLTGIPTLEKADIRVKEDYIETTQVPIKKEETKKEEEKKEEEKKEGDKKEEEKKEEGKKEEGEEKKEEDNKEGEEKKEEKKEEEEQKFETKTELKSKKYVLTLSIKKLSESVKTIRDNADEWKQSQRILKVFKMEEKKREQILTKINNLETIMYELKDIASYNDEKKEFLTEEDREKWLKFAEELEDFLFTGRPKESDMTLKEKEIRELKRGFEFRYSEWRERDVVIEAVMKSFNDFQNQVSQIQQNNDEIPDSEIALVQEKLNQGREWMNSKKEKLSKQKLYENPIITQSEIKEKYDQMKSLVFKLRHYKKKETKKSDKAEDKKKLREKLLKDMGMDPSLFADFDDQQFQDFIKSMENIKNKKPPTEDASKETENKEEQADTDAQEGTETTSDNKKDAETEPVEENTAETEPVEENTTEAAQDENLNLNEQDLTIDL